MKYLKAKTILIFVVVCISSFGYTQNLTDQQLDHILKTESESEILRLNTRMIISENFYHASLTADKLLTFDATSPNYNYRKGYSILNSSDDFMKSQPYLEIAVTN